jgi:DNA polymerase beta
MDYKLQIIQQLQILADEAKSSTQSNSSFRNRAYLKAINGIESYNNPIYSVQNLNGINVIGKSIRLKITEFIQTGHIKLTEQAVNPISLCIQELEQIYAIGPVKAKSLVNDVGISSVKQLLDLIKNDPDTKLLNSKQKLGLKYYDDILARIPHNEIIIHEEYLKNVIFKYNKKQLRNNSNIQSGDLLFKITGSYRRKTPTSGDIDVLVTRARTRETLMLSDNDVLKQDLECFSGLLDKFQKSNYIIDTLARGKHKLMGMCCLPESYSNSTNFNRRIDIIFIPPEQYAFGLLYFTGCGQFNVELRQRALDQGYSLNEKGMTHIRGIHKGLPVSRTSDFNNEKDILNFLGVEYIRPSQRIAGAISQHLI